MIKTILIHRLKAFLRKSELDALLTTKFAFGLIALMVFYLLYVLGSNLKDFLIVSASLLHTNKLMLFIYCGVILLITDLLMRLFFQEMPTLNLKPYLIVNVNRKDLASYMLFSSLSSVFNFFPLFLFTPFIFDAIIPAFGKVISLLSLTLLVTLTIFNNYIALYLKFKFANKTWKWLSIGIFILIIFLAVELIFQIKNNLNFSFRTSSQFYLLMICGCFGTIIMVVGALLLVYNLLRKSLYLESLEISEEYKPKPLYLIKVNNYFENVSPLTMLEIKLIFRNKYPFSIFVKSFLGISLAVVINITKKNIISNEINSILSGTIFTTIFLTNYGNNILGWQSIYFDGLLSSKVLLKDFIRSKFIILNILSLFGLLLGLCFSKFSWVSFEILISTFFWNIGIYSTCIMFLGSKNYKTIDLSKSSYLNGGTEMSSSYVLLIILAIIPLALNLLFLKIGLTVIGTILIILACCPFIFGRTYLINRLVIMFLNEKYNISEEFRKK